MGKSKSTFWRSLNPNDAKVHAQRARLKRYDITPEEWIELWKAQGGECHICKAPLRNKFAEGSRGKVAAVDHDHAVERSHGVRASVRGLICNMPCNRILTKFWTPEKLRRAADYIESPPARKILALCKYDGTSS